MKSAYTVSISVMLVIGRDSLTEGDEVVACKPGCCSGPAQYSSRSHKSRPSVRRPGTTGAASAV